MNRTNNLHNFQKVIGLIFLILIMVEFGLRAAGFILLQIQDQKNKDNLHNKDIVRIMCIGESTTYMGGDISYPSQLEEILNNANTGKIFKVINKGIPGVGSSYIVSHLPKWIKEFQPDIVVSMTGINDYYKRIPTKGISLWEQFLLFFDNIRVVKLMQRVIGNAQQNLYSLLHEVGIASQIKNEKQISKENSNQNKTLSYRTYDEAPQVFQNMYLAGFVALQRGHLKKAELIFQNLLDSPAAGHFRNSILEKLGEVYIARENYDGVVFVLKKRLNNPQDAWTHDTVLQLCSQHPGAEKMNQMFNSILEGDRNKNASLFSLIGACYKKQNDDIKASSYFQMASEIHHLE